MKIIKITKENKKEYEDFVLENEGSFLQSFLWGEFQESVGHKVFRFLVKGEGGEALLSASILKYRLTKKRSYLYIAYGPVVKGGEHLEKIKEAFSLLFSELEKLAKKHKVIFLKVEQEKSPLNLKSLAFKKSFKDIQARETLILNLEKTEEEVLKEMKQKTRYNIRLAKKRGVNVFEASEKSAAFSMFYSLLSKTSKRNSFSLHPKRYYENMIDVFYSDEGVFENKPIEKIFFAEWEGKILACALVVFYGTRATFLHGASSDENKNIMAPYLLHFEIIKKAKELGMKEYDLWGVVTEKTDKRKIKAWQGFSRFKEGFGGEVVEYEGAQDFVFSRFWYFLYRLARSLRF